MTTENPLIRLKGHGQSIWLDYIERRILKDGTLKRWIQEDGVAGMTSNPAIFEKAIAHTDHYRPAIDKMARENVPTEMIYEHLALEDVRDAADLFRPVFDATAGADGYVSLEVSPLLAHDTAATIREAHHLWGELDRPNVMIKVPATPEGLPAIRELIHAGLNVNVTLLFSVGRYVEVVGAYMAGLEARVKDGNPVDHVASVASFFLSRIDVKVDPLLDKIKDGPDPERARTARELRGGTALASAGMAYHRFQELFDTPRWHALEKQGAVPQRLLWASTSAKDPSYHDTMYVEGLIGAQTVNTVPVETLDAYRDHGDPAARLTHTAAQAPGNLKRLSELGIHLHQIDQELEDEGVDKFVGPFQQLLKTLDGLRHAARAQRA
ncbi:MAG: transaldolase [Chromatiales bacterium 21-64-14]|nr:MAG: transaldolase [Chromatiales bacterium 21-64-14]HQU15710.1 transaldolase [Gammaproteobacteria bacterium]